MKGMEEIDLHGLRVHEAIDRFNEILDDVRLKRISKEVMFITGPGKIQDQLKKLAAGHELNAYIPLSNRGCLVVEFE